MTSKCLSEKKNHMSSPLNQKVELGIPCSPVLELYALTAVETGSIPGQGTKIPEAACFGQK